jgi:hypothetical protein
MEVKLTEYDILIEYKCLYGTWGMDNKGYVAKRKDNGKVVILESYRDDLTEYEGVRAITMLNNWIHEYSDATMKVKKAIQVFVKEIGNANREV